MLQNDAIFIQNITISPSQRIVFFSQNIIFNLNTKHIY